MLGHETKSCVSGDFENSVSCLNRKRKRVSVCLVKIWTNYSKSKYDNRVFFIKKSLMVANTI